MTKIKLKKVVLKKENMALIEELCKALHCSICIADLDGTIVEIGHSPQLNNRYPIQFNKELVGWISGSGDYECLIHLISQMVQTEAEIKKLAVETLQKYRELSLLYDLSEKLSFSLGFEEIALSAIREAMLYIPATYASMMLVDDNTGNLNIIAQISVTNNIQSIDNQLRSDLGPENLIIQTVLKSGKTEIVSNVTDDPRFQLNPPDYHSIICAPLTVKGKITAVLTLIHKHFDYSTININLLNTITFTAALAIENAKLFNVMNETFFDTVRTLAETIEMRDPYTGGHTYRVMEYSSAIGKAMGLTKQEIDNLELAALMHDIGKIGIQDHILLKEGPLSVEEFAIMKKHTEFGAEILSNIKQLKDLIPGVRNHHEKYDGSGYPDGLKSQEISLFGRIIAVADSFDAMTSERPYREALDFEQAFSELNRCAGIQFDTNIVNTFIKVFYANNLITIKSNQTNKIRDFFEKN